MRPQRWEMGRTSEKSDSSMGVRHLAFLLAWGLGVVPFHNPVAQLFKLSFHSELYSHIPLIPVISL